MCMLPLSVIMVIAPCMQPETELIKQGRGKNNEKIHDHQNISRKLFDKLQRFKNRVLVARWNNKSVKK